MIGILPEQKCVIAFNLIGDPATARHMRESIT
jgi:hypothetical protein